MEMIKTISKQFILLLLLASFGYAQDADWQRNISDFNINDVFFINSTTGWGTVNGGSIVNTTDGGINWNLQSTL